MKTIVFALLILAISWASYRSWKNAEPDKNDPMFLKAQFYVGSIVGGILGIVLLLKGILEFLDVI